MKLDKILNSQNTVFTVFELQNLFKNKNIFTFKKTLSNYVKKWVFERIVRWVYAIKWRNIDYLELANKIYSPSYISFFTALYKYWVIFQYEKDVYLAYKKTDIRPILDFNINLKCLKKSILMNSTWIINNWKYSIASAERAILDTMYLYKDYYFDNISWIDLEKIKELLPIYDSKTFSIRVKKYFLIP